MYRDDYAGQYGLSAANALVSGLQPWDLPLDMGGGDHASMSMLFGEELGAGLCFAGLSVAGIALSPLTTAHDLGRSWGELYVDPSGWGAMDAGLATVNAAVTYAALGMGAVGFARMTGMPGTYGDPAYIGNSGLSARASASVDDALSWEGYRFVTGDGTGVAVPMGEGAATRAPIFADTNVLVAGFRANAGALAEIRSGTTYVTPNQWREFLNVSEAAARRGFLEAEGVQLFGGPGAGQAAGGAGFRQTFGAVVGAHGRGDAALVSFARETGYEAVTMERRLVNYVTQTLRDPAVPIRRITP